TSADGAGFYELDFDAMRDVAGGVGNAVAEQSAYEHDNRYIVATRQEAVQNFYLCRIERISAGESLSLTVRPDDTFCGLSDEWRCRTVRITPPATGTLSVSLISNDAPNLTGLELYQQGQQFNPGSYRCCSAEASLVTPIRAATTAGLLSGEERTRTTGRRA